MPNYNTLTHNVNGNYKYIMITINNIDNAISPLYNIGIEVEAGMQRD